MIHAGLCNIDVTRSFNKSVLPLKKCSDKSATLTLTCNPEFLQNLEQDISFSSSLLSKNQSLSGSFVNNFKHLKS